MHNTKSLTCKLLRVAPSRFIMLPATQVRRFATSSESFSLKLKNEMPMQQNNYHQYMTGAGRGLASHPYSPLTYPKFWTGSFPDTIDPKEITLDCKGKLPAADQEFKNRVHEVFERKGIVWVQNTGAESLTELQEYVDLVIEEKKQYKGGANSRGKLEANFLEVGAPMISDLHYHHEMSYVSESVTRLCFTIVDTLPDGRGATYMSDQGGVTDELL